MRHQTIPDAARLTTDQMMAAIWNPRYLAYCVAHGACSIEEMKVRDAAEFPGAPMLGYTAWLTAQLAAWRAALNRGADTPLSKLDDLAFDSWLADRVVVATAGVAARLA